jgi:hypothetical protein
VTFEPGQVLVSTPTPVAPQRFLCKVKTVRCEGHQIILETEQAKIIDAIHVTHVSRPVPKLDMRIVTQGLILFGDLLSRPERI